MSDARSCDVSVIVIGYNGRRIIDGCVTSLLDQDFRGTVEIIYADNHSVDGSVDHVAERFPAVRILRFDRNLGFAEGNNRAVTHATGRFLIFVNQDVVLHRHCLRALIEALQADATLGACQANLLMPWDAGFLPTDRTTLPARVRVSDLGAYGFVVHREVPRSDSPIVTRFVSGACFALERRVVTELGYLFDQAFFMYAEDLDLALRLSSLGYRLAVVPDAVGYHLHDEKGMPRKGDLLRAYRATRNRFIAYAKTTRMSPRLLFGAPLKAFEIGPSLPRQLALFLAMIPVTICAAIAALFASRRYRRQAS